MALILVIMLFLRVRYARRSVVLFVYSCSPFIDVLVCTLNQLIKQLY